MGGSDEVEIRILPDGRLAFSALPEALLEVAAAIDPRNRNIAARRTVLHAAKRRREAGRSGRHKTEREAANGRA